MADARLELARQRGIHMEYHDQMGLRHETTVETAVALLAALGLEAETEESARAHLEAGDDCLPWDVVCARDTAPWVDIGDAEWQLTFEDGTTCEGRGGDSLPVLPLGIHRLVAGARRITLLAAPPSLPLPARSWGMIAPLYGLSEKGVGSYCDLAVLAKGLGAQGAAFLGINPVHAGFPTVPGHFSPYSPSHRRRLNVLHLSTPTGGSGELINYAQDTPTRLASLRRRYDKGGHSDAFAAYLATEGRALETFGLHQALAERHGAFWSDWPTELQDPNSVAVKAARAELGEDIRFHAWLQWQAEEALGAAQSAAKSAGMAHGLYLDLAVGTHPHGAETWEDRDNFAFGVSLGAPPDAFAADGQNWGLAPFNPRALRDHSYAALAETFARQLRFAGALRIDHILGFERTFWVPQDAPGSYVQMPRDPMLAVARIEAARAQAIIIGEDLGNIPDGLRDALGQSGVLGCRVAMFERWNWDDPDFKSPEHYDEAAIASFSTHDLPTWKGWRQGADIRARQDVGDIDPDQSDAAQAHRSREVAAMDRVIPDSDKDALHGFLAATPSRLAAVQSEILLDMTLQQNLPGTTTEYPNWRIRLPVDAEALASHEDLVRVAEIMRQHDR
nr:4-alpha-glucanotransferase [uncultured Celeribacter sp.]